MSALRHATGAEAPVFAATNFDDPDAHGRHSGSIALYTESFVTVAEVVDAVSAHAWTGEHGSVAVSVVRREHLQSLRLTIADQKLRRGAALTEYEPFPWDSTVVASYEGMSAVVTITNSHTHLNVGDFYGQLLKELAAN